MGTCPPPKINSTADIFCSASNTHRLELVILPVRGWPSITVKGSLEFGDKNRASWINGQGACRETICLFICVSGSTRHSQKHLGLRKQKLQYGEFVGLPGKSSFSHNLLFPQDQGVNIFIIKRNHYFFISAKGTYSGIICIDLLEKRKSLFYCEVVQQF